MRDYDVIVVGAGPGGSAAAWAAASRGARTIVLEEHHSVGVPRHCTGFLPGSSFTEKLLGQIDSKRVVLQKYRLRRFYAPSGKLVAELPVASDGLGCCAILREEFDRELARKAVNAGAELVINTRVTGLLKEDGRIVGVLTASAKRSQVKGKVVIAADGLHAILQGIPKWEGLSEPDRVIQAGANLELTKVAGLEPDVLETFTGTFIEGNYAILWPQNSTSCMFHVMSMDGFEKIKTVDHPLGRRLRAAVVVQKLGWSWAAPRGRPIPKTIKDGLMVVGDAAGYTSMLRSVISGQLAGQVAAQAVEAGDASEARLQEYERLCGLVPLLKAPDLYGRGAIARACSDEALEHMLSEGAKLGTLSFGDQLPFPAELGTGSYDQGVVA